MLLNNKNTKQINTQKLNRPNNTNTKKLNSKLEVLEVSYPGTLLQSIKNNQNITNIPNSSNIYQNAPQITIQNSKKKLYLITMTDPDAPYGKQNTTTNTKTKTNLTNKTTSKNHTYTHWIYLQDMRNKTNSNSTTILFPYAPPSPPYGIHRYEFRLYDVSNISSMVLDTLKNNISNTLDRNIDYLSNFNNLKPIIKFQYKVNSGNLSTPRNTTPKTNTKTRTIYNTI